MRSDFFLSLHVKVTCVLKPVSYSDSVSHDGQLCPPGPVMLLFITDFLCDCACVCFGMVYLCNTKLDTPDVSKRLL